MGLADDAAEATRRAHEAIRRRANAESTTTSDDKAGVLLADDDTQPQQAVSDVSSPKPVLPTQQKSDFIDPSAVIPLRQKVALDPSNGGELPILGNGPGQRPIPEWSRRFLPELKDGEVIHMVSKFQKRELVRRMIRRLTIIFFVLVVGVLLIAYLSINRPFDYAENVSGGLSLFLIIFILLSTISFTRQTLIWKGSVWVLTNRRSLRIDKPYWGTRTLFLLPRDKSTILLGNLKSSRIDCKPKLDIIFKLDSVHLDAIEQTNDEAQRNMRGLRDAEEIDDLCNRLAEIYGLRGQL